MTAPHTWLAPVLMALLAAGCATTSPLQTDFAAWDHDGDGLVYRNEFFGGFTRAGLDRFWDRNRDETIDADEFADATFHIWDADGNGFLAEAEWREAVLRWHEDGIEFNPFATWDVDRDRRIDRSEFDARIAVSRLYEIWDRDMDRVITRTEIGEGFYRLWDHDESGYLDPSEWGRAELLTLHTGTPPAAASLREMQP